MKEYSLQTELWLPRPRRRPARRRRVSPSAIQYGSESCWQRLACSVCSKPFAAGAWHAPAASRRNSERRVETMKEYSLQTDLWLPRPRDDVFPFFAEARNLEALTPPWLNFEVLTPAPIVMRALARSLTTASACMASRCAGARRSPSGSRRIVSWTSRCAGLTPCGITRTHSRNGRGNPSAPTASVTRLPGGALINWLFVRRDVERDLRVPSATDEGAVHFGCGFAALRNVRGRVISFAESVRNESSSGAAQRRHLARRRGPVMVVGAQRRRVVDAPPRS